MFFVLSGFLIAYRYYPFLQNRSELIYYWWKRIARIFPLYYAILGLQWMLLYLHQKTLPDGQTFLLNITLLKGFSIPYFFSVLTQSWSLTTEVMFYLIAPLCFFLIKRKNMFLLQIPLIMGFGFLLVWFQGQGADGFKPGDAVFVLASTFFGRCFEFFVGIYLAMLMRKGVKESTGIRYTTAGGLLFGVLLVALSYFAYQSKIDVINEHGFGILLFNFLLPCAIGLFFYGLLTENSVLKKLLSGRFAVLLGESSYAFYLLHIGMLAQVLYFHVTANIFLLYLLLLVCSVVAYRLFEKPLYFYLLRKWSFEGKIAVKTPQQALTY
jgi:peptidoglycan/LPS O-acetylase OafA/YrhL